MSGAQKDSTCLWLDREGEAAAARVMAAVMRMVKPEIATLQRAFDGG